MSVARLAGIVQQLLLLYRCCTARMRWRSRGSVGWNCPLLCLGCHAHAIRAHTEAPFLAVKKKLNKLKRGRCCAEAATASNVYGVISAKSAAADSTGKRVSLLCMRLFLVSTAAAVSQNHTHAHTRTLMNPHTQAPFVAVTKGKGAVLVPWRSSL